MANRVVVIGAGFAGMGTAALLASRGFDVTVIEKNDSPGGRAMTFEQDGFRFDMGPSWYLMPDIFDRFFEVFGKRSSDFYGITRLNPSYRIFFSPDEHVDISSDFEENVSLFESIEPGAGLRLREYVDAASYQYRVAVEEFLYKDYRTIFDFLNRRTLMEGRRLHVLESMDRYARRFFASDKLRKILEYSMVFLGGSPDNTPALYSLLAHVDFNLGVWYPEGGIGTVSDSLRRLAEECGARFEFGKEATSIVCRGNRAQSVITRDGELPADTVVVNADYAHSELELLGDRSRTYSERYWRRRVLAPSAFMLYLGLSGKVDRLLHHTLSFEHDWMRHFRSIFESPSWPDQPSYYFCCPTKTDPSVAPEDCENVVVLVPVAPGLADDDDTRARYAGKTLDYVERLTGSGIRSRLKTMSIFSQRDFSRVFNAYRGTALGLSHTLMQSAVFRPSHKSKRVSNLYYTGQYTHPGIGLPMALISATVVSDVVAYGKYGG